MYVDVHAHLIHPAFAHDADATAERAAAAGVTKVIVNGLEPESNRAILELCGRHPNLLPALGIYPLEAISRELDPASWANPFPPPRPFDAEAEVDFIASVAPSLIAIGECGLDAYWVSDPALLEAQERVLNRLIDVALAHDLPLILHTRKAEQRTFDLLQARGVKRADFHCFGGKLRLAQQIAEAGYHLSIPPVVARSDSFSRMVRALPLGALLTETDCPYMGPEPQGRNEPAFVPAAVAVMAGLRGLSTAAMAEAIAENFTTLFRARP
jgi:TatD DNase family protein